MARSAPARRSGRFGSARDGSRRRLTRLRWSRWPRRLLAVALLLAAVVLVQAGGPDAASPRARDPSAAERVIVAAHDLAAGVTLSASDLAVADIPAPLVPSGAVRAGNEPVGRVTSGPVRAGEPLTDVRTIGPGYLAGLPDNTTAVPLRLSDPGVSRLLRAGDRIDVYTGPRGSPPHLAVAAAVVLTIGPTEQDTPAVDVGPLLLVAVPETQSAELASSAAAGVVTVTLTPP